MREFRDLVPHNITASAICHHLSPQRKSICFQYIPPKAFWFYSTGHRCRARARMKSCTLFKTVFLSLFYSWKNNQMFLNLSICKQRGFHQKKKKRIALCLPRRWLHANASRFSSSSHSHHNEDNILTQSRGFLMLTSPLSSYWPNALSKLWMGFKL